MLLNKCKIKEGNKGHIEQKHSKIKQEKCIKISFVAISRKLQMIGEEKVVENYGLKCREVFLTTNLKFE